METKEFLKYLKKFCKNYSTCFSCPLSVHLGFNGDCSDLFNKIINNEAIIINPPKPVETTKNILEKLKENAIKNYDEQIERYLKLSPEEIIRDIYHLNFINEWYLFLTSRFDKLTRDKSLLKWLSEIERPIDAFYLYFLDTDNAPCFDWDRMYEFVIQVFNNEEEK